MSKNQVCFTTWPANFVKELRKYFAEDNEHVNRFL